LSSIKFGGFGNDVYESNIHRSHRKTGGEVVSAVDCSSFSAGISVEHLGNVLEAMESKLRLHARNESALRVNDFNTKKIEINTVLMLGRSQQVI